MPRQSGFQPVALIRRKANVKALAGGFGNTAAFYIVERRFAGGHMQLLFKIITGGLQNPIMGFGALGPLALLRRIHGNFEPGVAGQPLDRFGERQIVQLHDKIDGAAMFAAAEAMIETLVFVHGEGRRFLVVEWTEASMFPAPLLQPHPFADQPGQIDAGAQFIKKLGREGHAPIIPIRAPPASANLLIYPRFPCNSQA